MNRRNFLRMAFLGAPAAVVASALPTSLASGGLVASIRPAPALFPGNMGLIGEAGLDAIIPLPRNNTRIRQAKAEFEQVMEKVAERIRSASELEKFRTRRD